MSKIRDLWLANRNSTAVKAVNEHLRVNADNAAQPNATVAETPLFGKHPRDVLVKGDVQNLNKRADNAKTP